MFNFRKFSPICFHHRNQFFQLILIKSSFQMKKSRKIKFNSRHHEKAPPWKFEAMPINKSFRSLVSFLSMTSEKLLFDWFMLHLQLMRSANYNTQRRKKGKRKQSRLCNLERRSEKCPNNKWSIINHFSPFLLYTDTRFYSKDLYTHIAQLERGRVYGGFLSLQLRQGVGMFKNINKR
jgi:hypothetical protein